MTDTLPIIPIKHKRTRDLSGHVSGKLTVEGYVGSWSRNSQWLCRCECGKKLVIGKHHLTGKGRRRKSCGCIQAEKRKYYDIYGHNHPLYKTWSGIIQRCTNEKDKMYSYYGGRGIRIYGPWRTSFETFAKDIEKEIGKRSKGKSLDRVKNNEDYKPGNVRWATSKTQMRNRRNNVMLTFGGQTKCLADWSDETGIEYGTLQGRIKLGWSTEKILETPVRKGPYKQYECRGQSKTLVEWCSQHNIDTSVVRKRMSAGWSLYRALTEAYKPRS